MRYKRETKKRYGESANHRNTPHFTEKTIILVLAYAFTAANLISAGILSAVEGNDSAQYRWLFLLGGVMAFMTPLQILDTRKEMRGTFAAVGAVILHFTFCAILAYLGSLWWLAVYGGQVLLCVFMLTARRIAHRGRPK